MSSFPCLVRSSTRGGEARFELGDPLVDAYLAFVAGRARANTLRAVAHDLKTFFGVVGKDPDEVVAADVFDFLALQRGDRTVIRISDGESGLSARTIARRLSSISGLCAAGVWCGSVWLTTEEAETHPVVKEKFLAATSADTVRSRSRTGKPARQLRSAWTDEWEDAETPMPLGMPMQPVLVDAALQRIDRAAHRKGSGAERLANYFVGQIVGTMNQSKSAAQVVYDMIDEFIEATQSLARQLET